MSQHSIKQFCTSL